MQRRLILGLALYVCLAGLVSAPLGWTAAYSALLGGVVAMCAITGASFLGLKATALPGVAAVNVIRSEFVKFLISVVGMALVFKLVHPLQEVIFLCVLFVGFLVVPLIGYRHLVREQ
tara:strand:+ start:501 stop:851 length:351 start_codon:yes stop_codon:yes gene_type:complete